MHQNMDERYETPQVLLIVDDDEINRSILGNIFAAHY